MTKLKREELVGKSVLVQSEMVSTSFYRVVFGKNGRLDRCNCLGVSQYLGQKKNGEPKYRHKHNCFHIEWARDYFTGKEQALITVGFDTPKITYIKGIVK